MARYDFNPLATVSPSSAPTPGQSQRASAEAFGGGIGRALQGMGEALGQASDVASRHAIAYQDLNNETDARQATTDYQNRLRVMGFGDPATPDQPGYFALKGQAAFNGAKPTIEGAQKARDDILNKLPNSVARRMAQTALDAHLLSFTENVSRGAANGRIEWMTGVHQASIEAYANQAQDNYNDPAQVNVAIAMAKRETLGLAEIKGLPPEAVVLEQQKVESGIRVGIVDRMLTDNPLAARDYYDKHMASVMPGDRAKVERAIKSATTPILTRNIADAQLAGADAPNPSLVDAVAQAESGGRDFKDYGKRTDGTPKGQGFLGELKRPDGKISTEISIGVQIDGKEVQIPTLIPGLTEAEKTSLLKGDKPSAAIVEKAVAHAKKRIADGKSPFAERELITSPKGAKGIMQVLDGTNKDPGFGIEPAKDASPAERARVGRDYLQAMLQRYGNQTVALAAYNWGPGSVDKVLERMGSGPGKSGNINEAAFVAKMPSETQAYVARINSKAPPVPGKPPTSDDIKANYPMYVERARAAAKVAFGEDSVAVDQSVAQAKQNMDEIIRGNMYREQEARNTVMAKVNGLQQTPDGGFVQLPLSQRFQTLEQAMADPVFAKAFGTMDSIQQATVVNRIGKDDNPRTRRSDAITSNIMGHSFVDPASFLNENFMAAKYVDVLPRADIARLQAEQNKMMKAQGKDAIKAQTWNHSMNVVRQLPGWVEAGLPSTIGKKTPDRERKNYQQFGQRLQEKIEQHVDIHKRMPSDGDIRAFGTELLVQGTVPASGWLNWMPGLRSTEQINYKTRDPGFRVDIPPTDEGALAAAFQKRTGRVPTQAELRDAYLRLASRREVTGDE